ncbi:MAG: FKBP-type peptidyl-prolyl cis-trans isomerase [Ignavibacteriales bacterium]|nr:FKBP-type peptidyl-prolyl cis-trans isomerase [Ignavibacteriales bacterium]
MKPLKVILIILLGLSVTFAQNKNQTKEKSPSKVKAQSSVTLKTQGDSVSYAIGQNIFQNLTDPFLQINFNVLIKSIQDAMNGKSDMTKEKVIEVLTALNKRGQERQAAMQKIENEKKKAEMAPIIEKNKKDGEAFLAENKNKEGVKTTASGLQYKVLVSGTGPSPKDTSKVKVHYAGKLLNGKEFDSSYKRNQPAEFPLNQVIKGWTEGLQLMHVGDKFEFYIPYQLAYGEEGKGETIPPASVLIFEVELLDIVK